MQQQHIIVAIPNAPEAKLIVTGLPTVTVKHHVLKTTEESNNHVGTVALYLGNNFIASNVVKCHGHNSFTRLTGYNQFVSYAMKKDGGLGLSMAEAVGKWSLLAPEEQEVWKVKAATTKHVSKKEQKQNTWRKITGYNLYIKEYKLSLQQAANNWKQFQQTEKDKWNQKAKELCVANGATNTNRTTKLTGYNLHMKENKLGLVQAAQQWRTLTSDQKNVWNNKAKTNTPVKEPVSATQQEIEQPQGYLPGFLSYWKQSQLDLIDAIDAWKQLDQSQRELWTMISQHQ